MADPKTGPDRRTPRIAAILALLLVASLSLFTVSGPVAPVAAAAATIDDGDPKIAWTGYWNLASDTRHQGGTEQVNGGVGATATLRFTGAKVTVVYSTGPDRAKAAVAVDGAARPDVDQLGARAFQQSVTYILAPGAHTIVVTNSGSRTSGSTGWSVGIDAFVIDDGASPPSTTTPTVTATTVPTATATTVPTATAPLPPTPTSPAGTTPVAGQQCPAWVHDQGMVNGPDGKPYATWHPPTHPTYGCWFGHEHGDNPAGSPALRGRALPFGHAAALANLPEPHTGFKVFRWDDIRHPNAPNHDGASVLMMLHQGTGGAARFTTVHHEVIVHYYNPRDGREVHIQMLAPFGRLQVGCGANDPAMDLSVQQQDVPGARQIAADKCFNRPNSPYEDWSTALYVGADATRPWRAYIDPHFAIFDPTTYCIVRDGACQLAASDVRAGTGQDPNGPGAHYKGAKRESYLNQVWLHNAGGASTIWTDPYGRLAEANAPGAIAQYVATVDARPQGNSAAFGADQVHDDGTVRAPN